MFAFDVKSGYHRIDIFEDDQQFVGFSWAFDGRTRYFKFTVLPLGLATEPYIFTKVLRPLVKHWCSQVLHIVVYLDDGLGACASFENAFSQSTSVGNDIINSGFVPCDEKCTRHPTQNIRWPGYDWDLKHQFLSIPDEEIVRLLAAIREALANELYKQLASATGLIMSNILVFGNNIASNVV